MSGQTVPPENPKGTEGSKITRQHGVGWGMEQRAAQTEVTLGPLTDNLSHIRGWGGVSIRLCTIQKEPRRTGKVFQGRGEGREGQGWDGEERKR